jgi:hypothetical protein
VPGIRGGTIKYQPTSASAARVSGLHGVYSLNHESGTGNMSKIVDPRGNTEITELYDTNGRGALQTLADGSTFQVAFTLNGNVVQQASITDPNGNVE